MDKITEEELRVLEEGPHVPPWRLWGPYVAERSWGTVREDYSANGDVWNYFPHDKARSKVYRWGEDGIAGICDRYQVLVFTMAFWNEKDPILKERFYGLSNYDGNHGEDVKECYFHLDNTPSHSYMKYLYKYPQEEYPYVKLVEENRKGGMALPEYELMDTGIFNEGKYFDIFIEYAKESQNDICIRIEVCNRAATEASIRVLPHLFFRNTWVRGDVRFTEPVIRKGPTGDGYISLEADGTHLDPPSRLTFEYRLDKYYLYAEEGEMLFTNNETNQELYAGKNNTPYVKDAFHRYLIQGEACLNPKEIGTKAAFHYKTTIPGGGKKVYRLRLSPALIKNPLASVDQVIEKRKQEADAFYRKIAPQKASVEEQKIFREALAGLIWNKQIYLFDVHEWLKGDNPLKPPPFSRYFIRNYHWQHLISKRVLLMPDKWEYPWFAAWDLAFHTISYALVDMQFAKEQLWFLLFDQFQHPNGQIPAYEWEFSELNPPVQAWAALRLFQMEYKKTGVRDTDFLKKCFHKLILNFVWWVNKVDSMGNNVFEGGFLGLDNITVIDRNAEIPGGGTLEQSDGTGWMGMFCLILMRIALELARTDVVYEAMAIKFFEHFVYISSALVASENRKVQLWNDEDGFFHDVLSYPDGTQKQIQVRSLVGIIPFYAVDFIEEEDLQKFTEFSESFHWFRKNRPDLVKHCLTLVEKGDKKYYLLSLMNLDKMQRVLRRIWDPQEFRSEYGLRSLSKYYKDNPYEFFGNSICYEPGESQSVLKGGNSNWRGPIWFPTTFLLVESLRKIYEVFGNELQIKVTGENPVNLKEMASYFAHAMIKLFKKKDTGARPAHGNSEFFHNDPYWKELILFYEHYHGDDGRGMGASHQGWSALVANFIDEWI